MSVATDMTTASADEVQKLLQDDNDAGADLAELIMANNGGLEDNDVVEAEMSDDPLQQRRRGTDIEMNQRNIILGRNLDLMHNQTFERKFLPSFRKKYGNNDHSTWSTACRDMLERDGYVLWDVSKTRDPTTHKLVTEFPMDGDQWHRNLFRPLSYQHDKKRIWEAMKPRINREPEAARGQTRRETNKRKVEEEDAPPPLQALSSSENAAGGARYPAKHSPVISRACSSGSTITATTTASYARLSNLPPPDKPYGRERELEAVWNKLLDPDIKAVAVTGPAGVGKSHLASYVGAQWQSQDEQRRLCFCLDASSQVALNASYLNLVQRVLRSTDEDVPRPPKRTTSHPSQLLLSSLDALHVEWLLIFDNIPEAIGAEDSLMEGPVGFSDWFFSEPWWAHGKVLLTTRHGCYSGSFTNTNLGRISRVKIGFLETAHSVRMLLGDDDEKVAGANTHEVTALAEQLGNLPLAMDAAKVEMRDRAMTVKEYLHEGIFAKAEAAVSSSIHQSIDLAIQVGCAQVLEVVAFLSCDAMEAELLAAVDENKAAIAKLCNWNILWRVEDQGGSGAPANWATHRFIQANLRKLAPPGRAITAVKARLDLYNDYDTFVSPAAKSAVKHAEAMKIALDPPPPGQVLHQYIQMLRQAGLVCAACSDFSTRRSLLSKAIGASCVLSATGEDASATSLLRNELQRELRSIGGRHQANASTAVPQMTQGVAMRSTAAGSASRWGQSQLTGLTPLSRAASLSPSDERMFVEVMRRGAPTMIAFSDSDDVSTLPGSDSVYSNIAGASIGAPNAMEPSFSAGVNSHTFVFDTLPVPISPPTAYRTVVSPAQIVQAVPLAGECLSTAHHAIPEMQQESEDDDDDSNKEESHGRRSFQNGSSATAHHHSSTTAYHGSTTGMSGGPASLLPAKPVYVEEPRSFRYGREHRQRRRRKNPMGQLVRAFDNMFLGCRRNNAV